MSVAISASGKHLHRLIHCDAYEEVHAILRSWPPNHVALFQWTRDRHSLLHMMAQRKPMERATIAARLIWWLVKECGCDPDAVNAKYIRPLWMAAESRNAVVVRALIVAGASTGREKKTLPGWIDIWPLHSVARNPDVCHALLISGYPPWRYYQQLWLDQRQKCIARMVTLIGIWDKRQPFMRYPRVERNVLKLMYKPLKPLKYG